jgi:hypothetical protein
MENTAEKKKLEIGDATLRNLNIARKWTMFLAVSGFIFFGLIVVLGLLTGTFLTAFKLNDKIPGMPDLMLMGGFLVFALINFFPIFFLFRFSTHTSNAVSKLDAAELHKAFRFLKLFFLYIGVLLILSILLYIAGIVISGASLAFLRGV